MLKYSKRCFTASKWWQKWCLFTPANCWCFVTPLLVFRYTSFGANLFGTIFIVKSHQFFYSVFTGQTVTNEKLIAWMAEIADKVKQVDDKIDLVLKNQEKLLLLNQQVPKSIEKKEDLEILGSLPVSNDSSFMELNKKLSEDSHLRHLLVRIVIIFSCKVL